ncbi:hypothetical protein LX32DRAFT_223241 [Colletotrichum zoysiae]|uniref:C2H2-type domain-containing protein n=1 Tax=Colletotrichum zoysiae TaxID=1216348 RepID=A0AAD9H3R4_9PEZI|nr:hypothetical protein LX32DRAFT_223241 [Colletotrichum zoysiae]
MAFTEQTARSQAGAQQPFEGYGYAIMGNSTILPYDPRAAMSAPVNGAMMAHQYTVAPQHNWTQIPTLGHQWSAQSHFAYRQYDSCPTKMNIPFRLPAQQARPVMPVAPSEHYVPQATSYPHEKSSAKNDRHRSPSSRSETKTSNPKTPHPLNTKEIKSNKPTSAEPVNFTTAIDTLMKAIQKRNDSNDIVKGVSKAELVVKPEPTLRNPEVGPTESTDAPKLKRYICDVDGCGKRFYQSTHLDTHRRAHTGEKPYQCNWPRCGRTFSQPGNLKTHMRRHTGEKPFRCEQCSKAFAQRGNLQTHMATHTNVKMFVCKLDDCDKMFTQRGNLKNHQNKYHEKTLMEMTDWIMSISDIDTLSDDHRDMYWYFANLYKNSNKGIKGRGKDCRVSNRGENSRTAPSSSHVRRVRGPGSLAADSSKRLPPPEQYMQPQQQQHHQHGSSASIPIYDGLSAEQCAPFRAANPCDNIMY